MTASKNPSPPVLLFIEDCLIFQKAMKAVLSDEYEVHTTDSGENALEWLEKETPDLVFADIGLPGMDGIETLGKIKDQWPHLPVVMLTGTDNIDSVVECMKRGAADYLTKKMKPLEIKVRVEKALDNLQVEKDLLARKTLQLKEGKRFKWIGYPSNNQSVDRQIQLAGQSDVTVLLQGETGTGKELVARRIHQAGQFRDGPFVAINCGALPKDLIEMELFGHRKGAFTGAQTDEIDKFELAQGGVLLLDEIGELPMSAQTKLLRILETKEFYPLGSNKLVQVDLKVLASTNRNLQEMIDDGTFRIDLYYRINTIPIHLTPLRERREDILPLCRHYLKYFCQKIDSTWDPPHFTSKAERILKTHQWSGNVRELKNAMERLSLYQPRCEITADDLDFIHRRNSDENIAQNLVEIGEEGIDTLLEKAEIKLLLDALDKAGGNKTKAASILGLSLPAYYYRLGKYGLNN